VTFAQYSGAGNGTESDPYKIYDHDQLAEVSNFLDQEGVVFQLYADIDLSQWIPNNNPKQGWIPIGVESSPFKGIFKGNKHKIKGLMINRSSTNHVGLFGYVIGATISDLTIEGSTITGASNTGVLAGYIDNSTITNCQVTMTGEFGVTGTSNVGGLLGNAIGTTCNGFGVTTTVKASNNAGGVVGCANGSTFSEGTVSGNLTVSGDYAGGFVGNGGSITLTDISMTGSITGQNYTGGIAGNGESMTLTNINMAGNVSGQDYTGGMAGCCVTGTLTTCNYIGTLSGNQYVGGIVGALKNTTSAFTSCFSKGKITATGDYAGGIVGMSQGACIEEMESCSHFGDIKGLNFVGGIIGAIVSADVKPQLSTYTVRNSDSSAGSLLQTTNETIVNGNKKVAVINNCVSIGNLEGDNKVGGLIGSDLSSYGYKSEAKTTTCNSSYRYACLFKDGVYTGKYSYYSDLTYTHSYYRNAVSYSLTNNYYSGTIEGKDYVGGLVGIKGGGEIKYNYSYATVFGSSNVGGIVGATTAQTASDSYSEISIKSNVANCPIVSAKSSNLGRIYGAIEDEGKDYVTIGALASQEGNRALIQTKVVLQGVVQDIDDDLQNGTSIGLGALKTKANYVSWGWDLENNWNIINKESFPYKKYQAAPPVIESNLVSKAYGISGKSINGGTVFLIYKNYDAVSTVCNGHDWTFSTEPLQSGAMVKVYADAEGMTPSYFATTFVGYPGSGTEEDPYLIYTAEDLQGVSNIGQYYKLMNDIDLTAWISENNPTEGWIAIGRNSGEVTYIDGDNHKVTGLWIDTQENFNGLFSNFSAGQIKNLTVQTASGKKVKGGDYTGILIGRNARGSIVNCTVKGDVEGTVHTGGVVGYVVSSTISDVTFNGSVTSASDNVFAGGLAGQAKDCTISSANIKSVINLSGNGGKAGGLIGESKGGTVKNSYAQPTLTATGENFTVGGLIGYSETPVSTSSTDGSVSAAGEGENTYAGGLVGYALSAIDNCYSTTKTTGFMYSAGLVGYTFNKIDKCYAKGDVYGSRFGAGVVSVLDGEDAALTNSVACCNIISLSDQASWGCRVVGNFNNGALEPDNSNYALSTMQVSQNNVPKPKSDNPVEGIALTQEVLWQQNTYAQIGWDFAKTWVISEGNGYPTLQATAGGGDEGGDDPEPDPGPVISADDLLKAADVTAQAGKTALLNINLTNKTTDLTAFQFELTLPQGVTWAKNEKGKYIVEKGDRFIDDGQALTVSLKSGNTYQVVSYSNDNSLISGTEGVLLKATVLLNGNLVEGSFEGKISNVKFTRIKDNQKIEIQLDDTKINIVVKNTLKGDANGDGEVTVTDIVEIVGYIMGNPSGKFVMSAADANGDGDISVTDIVWVVSIILSESSNNTRMAVSAEANTDNDWLRLTGNDGHILSLCLDNNGAYLAAQFELILSEGQSLKDIKLNPKRCAGLKMAYSRMSENRYQVMLYSLNNQLITGNSGELMNISVEGSGEVGIERALFVTEGKTEKRFSAIYDGTTGISAEKGSLPIDIYGIDGRTVRRQAKDMNGLAKGVYIINGKKHIVR
jgi:hypothetical protein